MSHKYSLTWLSDDLEGYRCLRCHYETVDPEDKFPCIYWRKDYKGFESLSDIDEDILWALQNELNIPGEFQGTLRVILDYRGEYYV